ncbi:hypothetical protein [Stenotrophomonas sp.]|uniref:hypothetical protein n=1 Tax=Stenotrophomonas sp. TaxID=69392 RepID=UPI0028A273FA|nr:hypothetical protein [Stenotrophomonas sp.]
MSSSRMSSPGLRWRHPCAIAVVIAVHGLMLDVLLGPGPATWVDDEEDRPSVRWLPRPAPLPVPLLRAPRPPAAARPAPASVPPAASVALPAAPPSTAPPDAGPLNLHVPGLGPGSDGLGSATFAPRLIGRRDAHRAFAPPPKRFRMQRGLTPEQLVQGIAQALQMWPPGYVVDPCRLSTAQVDYFQQAVDERDRDLLREALIHQRQDC